MTHDEYRELIQRELDGDVTTEERQLLQVHIASCDDCHREWDDYKKLAAAFGKLPKVMPDKSFVTLMEPELPKVLKKKRRLPAAFWPGLTAAAALVLTIGLTDAFGFLAPSPSISPEQQPEQVVQRLAIDDIPASTGPADVKHPEPQLILQEKVKEKPTVQVVAVSNYDLAKVQDQTGVVVEQQKVDAVTANPNPRGNGVVVVTVDAKPTGVKVDGDKVTVIVTQDDKSSDDDGSNVSVWGIAGITEGDSDEKTITFTDEFGRVIDQTRVFLRPVAGLLAADSALNRSIANAYNADPKLNDWAQDPYQVVYRHLRDLGFSDKATVSQSNDTRLIKVIQDDVTYQIRMGKTNQGYWQPVQISRMINPFDKDPLGSKVIAYFAGMKARGTIHGFGEIYLMERTDQTVKVSVFLERQDSSGVVVVTESYYDFQVLKNASGEIRLGDQVRVTTID
ncbi:hypothetical protein CIG75_07145 [Tumebacillus algifaecis]|uniref:Anti-sigma-W factor RsiW n=1 Tax=Tumebacillus algifaecis TaxID=1214604 RepID=A0A223D043_9BACL|nr:zf-HC2 domain-containing protein [Tumebacillus algifaecis]ASS74773.1 hypothetical protein CIG75_07145 [Tumebacillus algifaecis]